jgi:hypothetical protein
MYMGVNVRYSQSIPNYLQKGICQTCDGVGMHRGDDPEVSRGV